jgi:hypothetical protein
MILFLSLILLALTDPRRASPLTPVDPAELHVSSSAGLAAGLENSSISTILISPGTGTVRQRDLLTGKRSSCTATRASTKNMPLSSKDHPFLSKGPKCNEIEKHIASSFCLSVPVAILYPEIDLSKQTS